MALLTGKEVKQYREQAKLSQTNLGKKIGKSGQWISSIENSTKYAVMGIEMDRRLRFLFKLDQPKVEFEGQILGIGKTDVWVDAPKVFAKESVIKHNSITNESIKAFEAMQEEATKKIKEKNDRKVDLADEMEHLCADIIKLKHTLMHCKTAVEAMKR